MMPPASPLLGGFAVKKFKEFFDYEISWENTAGLYQCDIITVSTNIVSTLVLVITA